MAGERTGEPLRGDYWKDFSSVAGRRTGNLHPADGRAGDRKDAYKFLADAFLPLPIFALNRFLTGVHWSGKGGGRRHHRDRVEWRLWIRANFGRQLCKPEVKRTVLVKRFLQPRQRYFDDEGILGGSVKALNDALCDMNWLQDDSPAWRDLLVFQVKRDEYNIQEIQAVASGMRSYVSIFESAK